MWEIQLSGQKEITMTDFYRMLKGISAAKIKTASHTYDRWGICVNPNILKLEGEDGSEVFYRVGRIMVLGEAAGEIAIGFIHFIPMEITPTECMLTINF